MNQETFREFCLNLPNVTESLPFGPSTLVFKIYGKMFALMPLDTEVFSCNLKCDPDKGIQLRVDFEFITPGFHMNKTHWNTISTDHEVHAKLIQELVVHSYELVLNSIPLKKRI